ncbi:MAG: transcription-repair coupling factor [Candidatus Eisenbacteria bacterium]|nr:transcription-repair coupling factor [Candidatus Eisenbacteria bacterium]
MTQDARDHLLAGAARCPGFIRLATMLQEGLEGPVRLRGLSGGAAQLLVGHLYETVVRQRGTLLWILPDAEAAEAARDDLEFLVGEAHVLHFPEPETLPYDRRSPAPEGVSTRLGALDALRSGRRGVVVTSFRAIAGRVLPPDRLAAGTVELAVGQTLPPGALRGRLAGLGYRAEPVVSGHGEMSARGGILDVFASGHTDPLRIEWDGDEIVSLRNFDPQTQRSTSKLKTARLLPRRELVPDPDRVARVLGQLAKHPGEHSDELAHLVGEERVFEGMERLLGLYEPAMVPFLDYLPPGTTVLVTDWSRQRARAEAFADEVDLMYREAQREWPPVTPPATLFVPGSELERQLLERSALFDDSLAAGHRSMPEVAFRTEAAESFGRNLELLKQRLRAYLAEGWDVSVFCDNVGQRERLEELLENIPVRLDIAVWSAGFTLHEAGVVVLTDHEIFARYRRRQRRGKFRGGLTYSDLLALAEGDYIVHVDHGIGVYRGLQRLEIDGHETDCLRLEYSGGDKLFVPVEQLSMVQKYQAQEAAIPTLHKLGAAHWQRTKAKIQKAVQEMAAQLIRTYAARRALPGHAFGPDEDLQRQLEASFIYDETPDQLRAVEEVKADMESARAMDRLVCGDVGYGKTEVAVRAALKAVVGGKQVAVLVPTTILAQQHFNTFTERLAGFPVRVEMMSRFRTPAEQKTVVRRLSEGDVDIVIGTHRLLSKDVAFRDLGLVVIDEEHRFGVAHKEKLRTMRTLVDVLTLTATPIPRTLNLALSGARDMSRIETPPRDRLPVHTEVVEFNPELLADALLREADRGGQSFFVHNRVETIDATATFLRKLVPHLRFAVAHGQMHEHQLEKVMFDFLDRRYDCLVCTMIVESGLDIPSVNTLLVHHAENLGLAQLYQLRGRVGRSHHRAYCYLTVPQRRVLTETAEKRLKVIEDYDELGAGLKIAMKDLEIRGAGDLLGPDQTGFITGVGFEMYNRMLEEAMAEAKGEPLESRVEPRMVTDLPAYLPEDYVPPSEKISQYKRLADARSVEEVDRLLEEWKDRFGPPPPPAATLLELRRLRLEASGGDISQLVVESDRFEVELTRPRPVKELRRLFEDREYPLEFSASDPTRMTLRVRRKPGLAAARKLLPLLLAG